MTNNGAVPTSYHASPVVGLESISAKEHTIKGAFSAPRSWQVMFDSQSMGLPHGVSDAFRRIKTNLAYFRSNYAVLVLTVMFYELFWYPTSLILFLGLVSLWTFLYFQRDEPLKVFRFQIGDRTVLVVLSVITVAISLLVLFTYATFDIVWEFVSGAVLVLIHAVYRKTEDLFLDEEAVTTLTSSNSSS